MEWCVQNGVKCDKLEYPYVFEQGLVGARARKDIEHREAFLYVPFKLLISMEVAFSHQTVGHVFAEHPELFSKAHEDFEQLTLAVFMLFEYQKGKESFWFPYLNLLPEVEFFCNWDPKFLQATDDIGLVEEALAYKEDIEAEWKEVELLLLRYPQHFCLQLVDRNLFMRVFAQVCSRCFGWGLPTTAMIPMADNLNHSYVSVLNETINTNLHLEADEKSHYFTKDKFMNNYEDVFTEEQITKAPFNVQGRLKRDVFKQNVAKFSVENWKRMIQEAQIWELPYYHEDFEEDNDTSDEEESE